MKVRDFYSSNLLVAGVLFLSLGLGNWIIGAVQIAKFQGLLSKTAGTGLEESYRHFQQLDRQKNEEVLRRINEDREKYNAARVKTDFYYVVVTGGRLFFFLGVLLTFLGLIRLIRQDTLIKIRRLGAPFKSRTAGQA
ncbi:MAG: hypothetical protein A3F90_13175 [Deltaproteobacteria bacterium RIFCSPLOWO2_12_FULL_60_19]|jgi:hypothetical protein|nr:MAG: hypothetical protein A3F90_13175 [Deltaproteobacteria bacterium RIFCSPLOWO2_12_FULL_60_19]